MRRAICLLAAAALHMAAPAQTLAEAQAEFRQALRDFGAQGRPGTGPLYLEGLQNVWLWWPAFYGSPARVDGTGEFSPMSPPVVALPSWALAPLAEWVVSRGWPAARPPVVKDARWQAVAALNPPVPTAFVVAGPAVKDGVASYRREGSDTVARLGVDEGQASLWLEAARTLGWGVQMRMRETPVPESLADVHLSVVFGTPAGAPRVWVAGPAGVLEARLQRLHWGGVGVACESWIELRWPGAAEPAVWALLALADPAWAAGASVQRQPAKPANGEAQRGELRLALPAAPGLPVLRLRASRYEFQSADLQAEPDANGEQPQVKRGEAWALRVWTEATLAQPREVWETPPALSASGSPRCPVR